MKYCNTNEYLCDKFDILSGTSTGGIIIMLMCLRYTMDEIEEFYNKNIELIFNKKLYLPITSRNEYIKEIPFLGYIPYLGKVPYLGNSLRYLFNGGYLYNPLY
jgi:patatin-like phospholipase/acyl hydrolase